MKCPQGQRPCSKCWSDLYVNTDIPHCPDTPPSTPSEGLFTLLHFSHNMDGQRVLSTGCQLFISVNQDGRLGRQQQLLGFLANRNLPCSAHHHNVCQLCLCSLTKLRHHFACIHPFFHSHGATSCHLCLHHHAVGAHGGLAGLVKRFCFSQEQHIIREGEESACILHHERHRKDFKMDNDRDWVVAIHRFGMVSPKCKATR
mmetsp:Transcript_20676/g.57705  ORF Transcript_20676/g.57705 Transcript_20676/m.57705 type:complete len:201 (+) Transcript_20676:848-1450(+)